MGFWFGLCQGPYRNPIRMSADTHLVWCACTGRGSWGARKFVRLLDSRQNNTGGGRSNTSVKAAVCPDCCVQRIGLRRKLLAGTAKVRGVGDFPTPFIRLGWIGSAGVSIAGFQPAYVTRPSLAGRH
jgi:hypothetical protein